MTMLLRPDCRISAPPGKEVRNSAASNSRPAADSNCRRTAADTVGTDHRSATRCCSRNTSHTETRSTKRRSNRVRSDCGKAPNVGAYPPVRPGCWPQPSLCTRCHRCSSPVDAVYRCRSTSAAAEAAAVAVSCCGHCCSCIGIGWRGSQCLRTTTVTPSRF